MPSTIASTETTHRGRARTTAASSPMPRRTREAPGAFARGAPPAARVRGPSAHPSSAAMASMSERSAMPVLAVAVDDARAVEVVGRELAAHAIAGEDADAKAPHLARDVSEDDVVVVELDAEHGIGQRLDHLALEFDLVLLGHCACTSHPGRAVARALRRFGSNTLKLPARARFDPPRAGERRPVGSAPRRARAGAVSPWCPPRRCARGRAARRAVRPSAPAVQRD